MGFARSIIIFFGMFVLITAMHYMFANGLGMLHWFEKDIVNESLNEINATIPQEYAGTLNSLNGIIVSAWKLTVPAAIIATFIVLFLDSMRKRPEDEVTWY